MARTTRSAAQQQDKDKHQDPVLAQRAKPTTKKRKRVSLPDEDQPAPKQHRGENGIKEESTDDKFSKPKFPELDYVANVPLDPIFAQKVLEILEMFVHTIIISMHSMSLITSICSTGLILKVCLTVSFPFPLQILPSPPLQNLKQGHIPFALFSRSQHSIHSGCCV